MKTGVIILAAGSSRRMGFNKLIASYRGKPLVAHAVDAVREAGLPPPLLVVGYQADAVMAALSDRSCAVIKADDHFAGMGHSLAAGIAAAPADWDAALVMLADMPDIPAALIRMMARYAAPDSLAAPQAGGKRGHPVLFGRHWFPALTELTGDQGARQLIERHQDRLQLVDWPDPAILRDADVPSDLDESGTRRAGSDPQGGSCL